MEVMTIEKNIIRTIKKIKIGIKQTALYTYGIKIKISFHQFLSFTIPYITKVL